MSTKLRAHHQSVITIRKINYSNEETVFILDDNGDGFADFKIALDNQNEVVIKKKIKSTIVEKN